MPKITDLSGKPVAADDPSRGIWYSMCTYWTDDWDTLRVRGGIPCCPTCGSPGMQTTAADWFLGAAIHQGKGNPGYIAFLNQSQEQCRKPLGFMAWYREWLRDHPNGKNNPSPRSSGD